MKADLVPALMFVAIGTALFAGLAAVFRPSSLVVAAAIGAAAGLGLALQARRLYRSTGENPPPPRR